MFPDTPTFYDISQFMKNEDHYREDPSAMGLMWEIPLENSHDQRLERIRDLGIMLFGPSERKVTIIALPGRGTLDDIFETSFKVNSIMSSVRFDEVLTDHSLTSDVRKFGGGFPLIQGFANATTSMKMSLGQLLSDKDTIPKLQLALSNSRKTLKKEILKNPEKKQKFLELGEQILERVQKKGSEYNFEVPGAFGLFLNKKSLEEFLEKADISNLSSDEKKVEFYLNLVSTLNLSYDYQSGVGFVGANVKESFLEGLSITLDTFSKSYAEYDAKIEALSGDTELSEIVNEYKKFEKTILNPLSKKETELEQIDEEDLFEKSIEEIAKLIGCTTEHLSFTKILPERKEIGKITLKELQEAMEKKVQAKIDELTTNKPTMETVKELSIHKILPNRTEKVKSTLNEILSSSEEKKSEETLSRLLGQMHRMLRDDTEQDLILERGAWKKAWKEGDIDTLKKLRGCIEEIDYSEDEIIQVAERVVENVTKNKSSLFILPLSVIADEIDILKYIRLKGILPVQVVRKKPEIQKVQGIFYRIISKEGKEVGHLLGTIHVANENMMRLNPTIRQALEKAKSVYLETKPGGSMPDTKLALPSNLQESQKERRKIFIDLLFPKLIKKLTEEGASTQILNALSSQFKYAGLETRLNLGYSLVTQLSLHNAKIVHIQDIFNQIPVGIDHLLATHAMSNEKEVLGLEENTAERLDLIKQVANFQFFSIDVIERLPSTEEEVDVFLSKQLNDLTEMCQAWTSGNEEFIKDYCDKFKENPALHEKFLSERDTTMADNIHEALSSQTEENSLFFAVGSAHVVGSGENVIRQLEKKGWKLERV